MKKKLFFIFFLFLHFSFVFSSPSILASDREYLALLQIDDSLTSLTQYYELNYIKNSTTHVPLSYILHSKRNGESLNLESNELNLFSDSSSPISSFSTIISLSLLWHYRDDHWKQGGDFESLKFSKMAFNRIVKLDNLLEVSNLELEEQLNQIYNLFEVNPEIYTYEDFLLSTEFFEIKQERKRFIYSLGVHQIRLQILLGHFSEGLDTLNIIKKSLGYSELSLTESFKRYLCGDETQKCEAIDYFKSIPSSCSCEYSDKDIEENLTFNNIYELNYDEYFSSTSVATPSVLTNSYFSNKKKENTFKIDPILSYLYQLEGEIYLSKGGKYSKLYSFHYFIKSFLSSHCNHQVFYKLATSITFKSLRNNMSNRQSFNNSISLDIKPFSTDSLKNSFPLSSFSFEDILFDILETSEILLSNSFIESSSIILKIKDIKKLKYLRLKYITNKKKKLFFSKTKYNKNKDVKEDLNQESIKESFVLTEEFKKNIINEKELPLNLFSYTFPSLCYYDQNYDEFDFLYNYSQLSENFDLKIISTLNDDQQYNIIQGTFFWVNFLIYDHFSNFYTKNSNYHSFQYKDVDPNLTIEFHNLNQIIIEKLIDDNSKNIGLSWHSLEQARFLDKFRYLTSQTYSLDISLEQTNHMINYFQSSFWPTKKEVFKNHKMMTKKLRAEDENSSSFFGINSYTPVFIVGFFRSGSTLLETLLDRHPSVWGMGESSPLTFQLHALQDDMLKLAEEKHTSDIEVMESHKKIIKYHANEILRKMNEKHREYYSLNSTDSVPKVTRIVDKMLINYKNIPFIHLLFPNALIINTVRDPIDTLFSCLKNRFGDFSAYTLDFNSLIQEYINYLKIMEHFRSILPNIELDNGISRKPILDVRYETLLISPEIMMKKIFNFMNFSLSDEEISKYYGNIQKDIQAKDRLVKTASYLQVKEPLYLSSIGKWKKFQIYLESSGFLKTLRYEIKNLKKNKNLILPYYTQSTSSSSLTGINWDIDLNFNYEELINELQKIFQISDK